MPDSENYWALARKRRDEFSGEWEVNYAKTILRVGAGRRNIAALAVLTIFGMVGFFDFPGYFALTLPSLAPGVGIATAAALIACYAASFKFIFPFWLAAALFFIDSVIFLINSEVFNKDFYMSAVFRLGALAFLFAGAVWAVKLKRLKKGL